MYKSVYYLRFTHSNFIIASVLPQAKFTFWCYISIVFFISRYTFDLMKLFFIKTSQIFMVDFSAFFLYIESTVESRTIKIMIYMIHVADYLHIYLHYTGM